MGLPRLEQILVRAGEEWGRLWRLRFASLHSENYGALNREHQNFIVLLCSGDVDSQVKWIQRHNREALERSLMTSEQVVRRESS